MVVDSEDPQLLVEDIVGSVALLLQLLMAELQPTVVELAADMAVDLTETHQAAVAEVANPGGNLPFDDVSSDNYSIRLIDLG